MLLTFIAATFGGELAPMVDAGWIPIFGRVEDQQHQIDPDSIRRDGALARVQVRLKTTWPEAVRDGYPIIIEDRVYNCRTGTVASSRIFYFRDWGYDSSGSRPEMPIEAGSANAAIAAVVCDRDG